jgi:hypothetical protein
MSDRKAKLRAEQASGHGANAGASAKSTAKRRASASRAGRGRLGRVIDHVTANPLTAVFGAVAVSAGLALLLPSSERENEVMGDVADKLGDVAQNAADSVVAAGRAQVETLAQTALAGVGGAMIQAVTATAQPDDDEK